MQRKDNIGAIEELAISEGGIFTSAQASRMEIPRYALAQAAKAERIERIFHAAYRLSAIPSTELDALRAAYKLTVPEKFAQERMGSNFDGVAVCGRTAAFLLGIGDMQPTPWQLGVPKRFNSRMEGVQFRMMQLSRNDIVWLQGLPVTRVEVTLKRLIQDHEEESLVAGAFIDAVRRYGATTFDMDLLRDELGSKTTDSLLSAAGIHDGGPYELLRTDSAGHVALRERQ